jgi:hypothetical protein
MGVGEKVVAQLETINGMARQSDDNKRDFRSHESMGQT